MTTAQNDEEIQAKLEELSDETPRNRIKGLVYWIALIYGAIGILVAMNQTFSWDPFGYVLVDNSYFYLLIGIFLPISFLVFLRPAVSIRVIGVFFISKFTSILSLVVPGMLLVIALFSPTREFNSVDFPTFGSPQMVILELKYESFLE